MILLPLAPHHLLFATFLVLEDGYLAMSLTHFIYLRIDQLSNITTFVVWQRREYLGFSGFPA